MSKLHERQKFEVGGASASRTGHAVVAGGSLAGLLAARVLADRFERVTVVERDRFPSGPEPRAGTPQAHHLHVLLLRGLECVDELFPGIRAELRAHGAVPVDTGADLAWLTPAGWGPRFESGLVKLAFTRGLLDWLVRRRLAAIGNVGFLDGCAATGLVAARDGRGAAGLVVRHRDATEGGEMTLPAELVVDAGGRSSSSPRWIEALGYAPPRESVVDARLGYASRLYARPPATGRDWKAAFVQAAPPEQPRAAVLFPVEGDRWMLTVVGGGGDYPPNDEAGLLDFVRSLPTPIVYDAIEGAEPISPIRAYRATENRRRHWEELDRLPEGFLALGDAVCAFNPVYGQGMTVAALGAVTLARSLDGGLEGLPRRFQRALAGVVEGPWVMATSEDCRYRNAEGTRRTWRTRLMQGYMDRIVAISTRDLAVRRLWLRVFHMLESPTSLFAPRLAMRVAARTVASVAGSLV